MSDLRRWAKLDPGPFKFGGPGAENVIVRRRIVGSDGSTAEVWIREGQGPYRRVAEMSAPELRRIATSGREPLHHLTDAQLRRVMNGEDYETVVAP